MKQKIYVVFISLIAISLLVVSFMFAINYKKNSVNYFYDSGYILSNNYETGSNNVNKLYFEAETSYKVNKDNECTFTNSEGEKVNVNEESFVHYSNGAIMSLKKGVALDLNNIDEKIIKYYNIFDGSILNKKGEKYEIDNLNDKITFSKLMFKISGEKYLIGAPKIVVSFSDNQSIDMEDYVEIEYVSENVIRIYNDKVNYQTIASNLYIIVGDVKIDLEYKTISKNNVEYLTMADMIINSNDNIEVLPKPEEPKPEKPENNNQGNTGANNQENSGGNNQGNQNNGNGANNGNQIDPEIQEGIDNIIGNLPNQDEQLDTEEEYIQPKFRVDSMEPTTLGFENLKLSFEDESSVLYGPRTVQILENSTGKVVQQFEDWQEGSLNYAINSFFSLKPNTEYTLNVVGQYKIEDTVFDRTFISKIFRTLDIGLEITEDYITPNSLSFAIYKNEYSEVSGFTYNITDKDGNIIVEDTDIRFENKDVVIISENDKFNENTKYILTLKDMRYGDDVFATVSYEKMRLTHETKTLKENPFKNSEVALSSKIDSRENTITLNIDGVSDLHGGIKSFTYNIYNSIGELKHSITREKSNQLTIDFEKLDGEDAIYFNVEIDFDDNEKTIIYLSKNSDIISISGLEYPKVVEFIPTEDNEDSENLIGEVLIDDKLNFVAMNDVSYYKMDIKENTNSSLGGTQQYVGSIEIEYSKQESQFTLPVYIKGLKPSTEYVIYVYLMHNGKYIYIGYTLAKTIDPAPIYLNIEDITESSEDDKIFDFQITKNINKPTSTVSKVKRMTLDLYGCSKETEQCKKLEYSATIPKTQDGLELTDMMYHNQTISFYSSDFWFYLSDYNNEYSYKVIMSAYANNYEIPIKINDTDSNEFKIDFNAIDPYVEIKEIEVLNSELGEDKDGTLNDETIVGFNFETKTIANPMGDNVETINYSIFENPMDIECDELIGDQSILSGQIEPNKTLFVPISNENETNSDIVLKRGINYCLKYNGPYLSAGEEKQTKEKSIKIMALKQRLEIDGYISEYDGDKLNLKLNINDPDNALIKDSLKLTDGTNDFTPNEDYLFNGVTDNVNYSVLLKENIGYGEKDYKIYEFKLDDVVNYDEINVKVDTTVPGEVTLKIPYNYTSSELENDEELGLEELNKVVVNSDIDIERIAGLSIKYNNNISYFNLNKNDTDLYVKLSLNDVISKGYGKITGTQLVLGEIKVIYDTGKVIDYLKEESLVFVKSNNNKYYSNKDFKDISIDSVFNTLKLAEDVPLIVNKFNSIDENSRIGLSVVLSDKIPTSIKFNEVVNADAVLYDKEGNQNNEFTITEAITTSEINTVSTSTGAITSFDIKNNTIMESTRMQVVLNQTNEIAEIVYSNGSWSTYNGSSDNKIKEISVDGNTVTIHFDNIMDQYYDYSINYNINTDNIYRATYNEETTSPNVNIKVESLKELYVIKKSTEYIKDYWKWNDNETDIVDFTKTITNYFEIDTSKYLLSDREKIEYEVIAKNVLDNTENGLLNKSLSQAETESKISKNTANYNIIDVTTLPAGDYLIKVKPSLITESGEKIELKEFNLSSSNYIYISYNEPTFKATNGGAPNFRISMNDADGMLSICSNEIMQNSLSHILDKDPMGYVQSSNIQSYFDRDRLNSKVVYLELYSKYVHEDKIDFVYRGFTPVPFTSQSAMLELSEFFAVNSLPSGEYKLRFNYCINNSDELKIYETGNFNIINTSTIKMRLVPAQDSYLLMLENPDIAFKDAIKRIVYQYKLTDGTIQTRELSNLDNEINNSNNIDFIALSTTDNQVVYFVGISTGGTLISNIENIEIRFYSGISNDTLLYTYSV